MTEHWDKTVFASSRGKYSSSGKEGSHMESTLPSHQGEYSSPADASMQTVFRTGSKKSKPQRHFRTRPRSANSLATSASGSRAKRETMFQSQPTGNKGSGKKISVAKRRPRTAGSSRPVDEHPKGPSTYSYCYVRERTSPGTLGNNSNFSDVKIIPVDLSRLRRSEVVRQTDSDMPSSTISALKSAERETLAQLKAQYSISSRRSAQADSILKGRPRPSKGRYSGRKKRGPSSTGNKHFEDEEFETIIVKRNWLHKEEKQLTRNMIAHMMSS